MCIIAYRPEGAEPIKRDYIRNMAACNDDGGGIMYPDGAGGLAVVKSLRDVELLLKHAEQCAWDDVPYVMHFRIRTHGKVDLDNCQPFYVDDNHGLAHNGILDIPTFDDRSDTKTFTDEIVAKFPTGWFESDGVWNIIREYVGSWNKIVVMRGDGDVRIVNEKGGIWDDGSWYSNSSYRSYSRWAADPRSWFGAEWDDDYDARVNNTPLITGGAESCERALPDYDENDVVELYVTRMGTPYSIELPVWAIEYASSLELQNDLNFFGCFYEGEPSCYGCVPVNSDTADFSNGKTYAMATQSRYVCVLCGEPIARTNTAAFLNERMVF